MLMQNQSGHLHVPPLSVTLVEVEMLSTSASKVIEYGDSVIIYSLHMGRVTYTLLVMQEKQIFDCFHGHFPHSKIVGLTYGSKVCSNILKEFKLTSTLTYV